jgi:hypothetical protein
MSIDNSEVARRQWWQRWHLMAFDGGGNGQWQDTSTGLTAMAVARITTAAMLGITTSTMNNDGTNINVKKDDDGGDSRTALGLL